MYVHVYTAEDIEDYQLLCYIHTNNIIFSRTLTYIEALEEYICVVHTKNCDYENIVRFNTLRMWLSFYVC